MSSIKKRPDGKYRARYRDAEGKEHAKHFTLKRDAERWLNEQTASIVTGQYVDPKDGDITFRAYFDDWSKRQVWTPGTVRAMKLAAYSTTFVDLPLKKIDRTHLEGWVKAMQTADRGPGKPKGLAPGTVKTRYNNVGAVLRAAVRDKKIFTDPSEGVTLPRQRRAEAAMELPTAVQVRALLDHAAVPWMRTFIALAAFAGLRLGEAAAVQLGDVNFLGRVLKVARQVQRGEKGTVLITLPKYGSERPVYLTTALVELLSAHPVPEGEQGWLFLGEKADPPHQNTVGYWWRKTCKAAGVTGVTLHDLRHWYASGLIAQGCDVVTVQKALGHARATTTLNTYAHLWPTAEDRTRKAADKLMAETFAADQVRTGGPRKVV